MRKSRKWTALQAARIFLCLSPEVTWRCLVVPLWHNWFWCLLWPTVSHLILTCSEKAPIGSRPGQTKRCRWAGVAACLLIMVRAICDRHGTAGCAPPAMPGSPGLHWICRQKQQHRAGKLGAGASGPVPTPCAPSVCSYHRPGGPRPGARFLTHQPPVTICLSQTRRGGGALPGRLPCPPSVLRVSFNVF